MNEDYTARTKGLINKATGEWHMNEKILIGVVANGDAVVPYTRLRMFGRDGLEAN
jgi:hypothetical protein